MRREHGGVVTGIAVAGAILFFALMAACIAIANDDDDNGLGVQQLVSHEYCESNSDCYGGYDEDNGQYDRNRNRDRNRGAFSPGPFDDSPVDAFNGNTICLPGSTCNVDDKKGEQGEQPPEQQPMGVDCLVPFPYHCDPAPS